MNLALEDRGAGENLGDLFVEDVFPAPHCGRLLVSVVVPEAHPVADVMAALERESPRLRAEVAAAVTRKRAPELSFVPALPGGDDDE